MVWHIGEILIQKKLISWEQLQDALQEQKKTNELTGQILVRKGYVPENLFYKALAEQYNIRFLDLKRTRINPKALAVVPRSIAEKYTIIPVEITHDSFVIAIPNPRLWPEEEIKELTRLPIRAILCTPEDIKQAIRENYN